MASLLPILVLCAGLSAGALSSPASLASVDGEPIPASLYRMYLANGVVTLGLDVTTDEGRRRVDELKRGIVSELIDRALVEAEAKRRALAVLPVAAAARIHQLVSQMGGETAYRAHLAAHGLSEADFLRSVRQEIAGQLLHEVLTRDVAVSDGEIRATFDAERSNPALAPLYTEPEQVEAAHILVKTREQADALRGRLLGGEDFAALARQFSDDAASRPAGGSLGRFGQGSHSAAFEQAAFALKPGETSPVVRTEYGFHVIRVTGHSPQRARTQDEVRPALEARLVAGKRALRLTTWLETRRREAAIQVDPAFAVLWSGNQ